MNNFFLKFDRTWTSYCNHMTYIYIFKLAVPMHYITRIKVKVSKVHELARFFLENVLSAVSYTEHEQFLLKI